MISRPQLKNNPMRGYSALSHNGAVPGGYPECTQISQEVVVIILLCFRSAGDAVLEDPQRELEVCLSAARHPHVAVALGSVPAGRLDTNNASMKRGHILI